MVYFTVQIDHHFYVVQKQPFGKHGHSKDQYNGQFNTWSHKGAHNIDNKSRQHYEKNDTGLNNQQKQEENKSSEKSNEKMLVTKKKIDDQKKMVYQQRKVTKYIHPRRQYGETRRRLEIEEIHRPKS